MKERKTVLKIRITADTVRSMILALGTVRERLARGGRFGSDICSIPGEEATYKFSIKDNHKTSLGFAPPERSFKSGKKYNGVSLCNSSGCYDQRHQKPMCGNCETHCKCP